MNRRRFCLYVILFLLPFRKENPVHRPPDMEAVGNEIDVFGFLGMDLNTFLFRQEEKVFDCGHLIPGWKYLLIPVADGDMLQESASGVIVDGSDYEEGPLPGLDLE